VVLRDGAVVWLFVDGGAAAAGVDDGPCAGVMLPLGCGDAAAAGAVGLEAGLAIAFTALRQDADSFDSLRMRHSRASLPPGCTLAQLAMKSERQEARMASRCASDGCCAAAGTSVSAMRQPVTSEDLNIEPYLAYFDT
jgi:hypothetical protein